MHCFAHGNIVVLTCLLSLSAAREDEKLNVIFENSKQMMAILPTIVMASNPFQSGSSLSNLEARQKALDFKLRLLVYYFNQSPPGRRPPGLPVSQDIRPLQGFTMQCMVSKLSLDSNIVTAAYILPKASSRVSFMLYL